MKPYIEKTKGLLLGSVMVLAEAGLTDEMIIKLVKDALAKKEEVIEN